MHVGYDFVAVVAIFTLVAGVLDLRTRKVPNWLTVPVALVGLAYNSLAPGGSGLLLALAGLAIGFSLLILPWILGGGGMGDVKLLAALGAWLGPLLVLVAFGLASVLAAAGAIAIVTASMLTAGFSKTRQRYVAAGNTAVATTAGAPPRRVRRVLPFAVPVAIGTWLVLGWLVLRSQGL